MGGRIAPPGESDPGVALGVLAAALFIAVCVGAVVCLLLLLG